MKKFSFGKSYMALAILVVNALALMMVLAGCASAQTSGGNAGAGNAGPTAASPAADLVRALGGNATATLSNGQHGSTVTLSGDARVEGDLPLPEGNTTINGNGTIYLQGKGSLFNIGDGQKLILDGVTLVGVADNDSTLVRVGSGGELVLKSGAITGNNTINASGSNSNGGGVFVADGGTFTMSGGGIYGNTASSNGGGIWVHGGTFIMEGGEIYGNTALNIEDPSGGGGIFITGSATLIMEGGTIYGSDAEGGKANANNSFTSSAAITIYPEVTAKWGTGGTYTIGGVPQSGGTNILQLDEYGGRSNVTLIAIPAR